MNDVDFIKPAIESIIHYYTFEDGFILSARYLLPLAVVLYAIYYLNKKSVEIFQPYFQNANLKISKLFFLQLAHSIKLLVLCGLFTMLYYKFQMIIPVDQPAYTRQGLEQRIAVFDKIEYHKLRVRANIQYKESQRRPGSRPINLQPVLFWYLAPTSSELKGLEEYLQIVFMEYSNLYNNEHICNNDHAKLFSENSLLTQKEALSIVESINNYYVKKNNVLSASDNIINIVDAGLKEKFICDS